MNKLAEILKDRHQEVIAAAAVIQAIAAVAAGLWFGWAFYYSEVIKPKQPITFLNPQLRIEIAGREKDVDGVEYYVLRLDLDVENKSGQNLSVAASSIIVYADKISSKPIAFDVESVQVSVNDSRGSSSRYRGRTEKTQMIYAGSEFAGWRFGVGEKATQNRLFRVPVGEFDQLEANWYTLSGAELKDVQVARFVSSKDGEDFFINTCVCKGFCPRTSKTGGVIGDAKKCIIPWVDLASREADVVIGGEDKSGTARATTFLVLPPKSP
ncbi:hypothetical protein D3C71_502510 [compost metagenome]